MCEQTFINVSSIGKQQHIKMNELSYFRHGFYYTVLQSLIFINCFTDFINHNGL